MKLTDAEYTKIMTTLIPVYSKRYQVCFSVFLIVIMICLMNYFNVLFDKNLIFISFLLIFSLPIATYGLMSYDLVQLIYKSRFYFQRGIISNHKNGKKKTHVFLTETETYLKENFPIKLGFDENCYDIEGKPCLLLEIHRNRKIVILL